jgi:hypothetical protein
MDAEGNVCQGIIYYFLPTDRPTPAGGGPESSYLNRVAYLLKYGTWTR